MATIIGSFKKRMTTFLTRDRMNLRLNNYHKDINNKPKAEESWNLFRINEIRKQLWVKENNKIHITKRKKSEYLI